MSENKLAGIVLGGFLVITGIAIYLSVKNAEKEREQELKEDEAARDYAKSISDPYERRRYLDNYNWEKRRRADQKRMNRMQRSIDFMRLTNATRDLINATAPKSRPGYTYVQGYWRRTY